MSDTDTDTEFKFEVDGEVVSMSLAEIAGVDMDDVEEFRGMGVWPAGNFTFEYVGFSIGDYGDGDDKKPILQNELKCVGVTKLKDPEISGDDLLGKTTFNNQFVNDPAKALGAQKAFFVDIGLKASGTLQELGDNACGLMFECEIKHQKSNKDPDRVFTRFQNITPFSG